MEPNLLNVFQTEIAELKKKESGEGKSSHLADLDPEDLGIREMEIYTLLKNSKLTIPEFKRYIEETRRSSKPSQKIFVGYIANLLQSRL